MRMPRAEPADINEVIMRVGDISNRKIPIQIVDRQILREPTRNKIIIRAVATQARQLRKRGVQINFYELRRSSAHVLRAAHIPF